MKGPIASGLFKLASKLMTFGLGVQAKSCPLSSESNRVERYREVVLAAFARSHSPAILLFDSRKHIWTSFTYARTLIDIELIMVMSGGSPSPGPTS